MLTTTDECEATAVFALSTFKVLVPFFSNGVPLSFAAAAPSCRLAAETYRAEENSTWVAGHGLHTRSAGDRESFNVYEARRWRRVGVQIGPLISTFHDATGINGMGRGSTKFDQPDTAEPWSSSIATFPSRPLEAGEAASRRKLVRGRGLPQSGNIIRDEFYCADDFPAYPQTEDVDAAFAQWKQEKQPPAFLDGHGEQPLDVWSWTLTGEPDVEGVGIGQRRRQLFFYGGRNRRTVYLWMDGASVAPNAHDGSNNYHDDLQKLLDLTRWWFVRPPVSSMKYMNELYAEKTGLTLPSPAALYLHLYGSDATAIPRVCSAYLRAEGESAEKAASQHTCAGRTKYKDDLLDALFSSSHVQSNSTALIPLNADGSLVPAASSARRGAGTPALKKVELLPVLEGLFLVSHPPLTMQLKVGAPHDIPRITNGEATTASEEELDPRLADVLDSAPASSSGPVVVLRQSDVGHLAILKMSGVDVDDDGLRRFLGVDASARDAINRTVAAQMPFLELLDVSFNINLRHFALVDAHSITSLPPTSSWAMDFYRRLTVLNLQCTSITSEDAGVLAQACPNLCWLNVACCQYLQDLSPLATLEKLYYLDAHGTAVDNKGIANLWECKSLEDLNLSGCQLLNDLTPLSRISTLRRLDVRDVLIRDGLQSLEHCQRLQQLLLAFTALSHEKMIYTQPTLLMSPVFSHMGALRVLFLVDTPLLSNDSLASLAQARAPIEDLQLRRVPNLTCLDALMALDSLRVLGIQGAEALTVEGISSIGELCSLRELKLRECPLLNDFRVVAQAPRLRVADISFNDPELNDKMLESVGRAGAESGLQQLRLAGYKKLRNISALAHLPSLEVLDVSGCSSITMTGISAFSQSATLVALTLRGCCLTPPVIYRKDAHVALSAMVHLRELDLSHTGITDATLRQLTQEAKQLEMLNLSSCTGLRYESCAYQMESLRVLHMRNHPNLTVDLLRQFFRLKRDAPARVGNPTAVTFPMLETVDVSHCSMINSLEPFCSLQRLRHLEMEHTTVIAKHLHFVHQIPTLLSLNLASVESLDSNVWPIFSHPALLRIDLRSSVLSSCEDASLPADVLANTSPLRELIVSGAAALEALLPILSQPATAALRYLMLLVVESTTAKDVELCEVLMHTIRSARPLLSTRYL